MFVVLSQARPIDWALRDYKLPPVEWEAVTYRPMPGLPEITIPGVAQDCEHRWGEYTTKARKRTKSSDAIHKEGYKQPFRSSEWVDHKVDQTPQSGQFCLNCGGWRGCLGLEPTIEMFVGHIVLVWRELWRVLADDGICWLNVGSTFAGKNIKSDMMMLREDLTEEEYKYVLGELAKIEREKRVSYL